MLSSAWSAALIGVEAVPVEVETHVRAGLPGYAVVGLPQTTVRESRERVLSAIRSSGLPIPRGAITVSMAPADIRKDGALFDLPLALGMLAAGEEDLARALSETFLAGELALDGRLRPVPGILSIAELAAARGARLIVPAGNLAEARRVAACRSFGADTLAEARGVALGLTAGTEPDYRPPEDQDPGPEPDLSDVGGQAIAKRALEIAAVGGHHVLLTGPPGAGKTMLASRMPGILSPLTEEEALELSRIYSVAGMLSHGAAVEHRPFRAPHHSISRAGLIGGGNPPRPGEISLATHGVLFLDEFAEFSRDVLESLRQPIESGVVHIRRARYSVRFPARVSLVASINPCPCGHFGTDRCLCDPLSVQRYVGRLSGPIRDRMDLTIGVDAVSWDTLNMRDADSASAIVRARVEAARAFAAEQGRVLPNAMLPDAELRGSLGKGGRTLLRDAVDRLGLSARGVSRVIRVARSVADLRASVRVTEACVAEALGYRG